MKNNRESPIQEQQSRGAELGGFAMDDIVYLPGDRAPKKIVGINHERRSFLLEDANHNYTKKRKEVSLEELQLWKKFHKTKK